MHIFRGISFRKVSNSWSDLEVTQGHWYWWQSDRDGQTHDDSIYRASTASRIDMFRLLGTTCSRPLLVYSNDILELYVHLLYTLPQFA